MALPYIQHYDQATLLDQIQGWLTPYTIKRWEHIECFILGINDFKDVLFSYFISPRKSTYFYASISSTLSDWVAFIQHNSHCQGTEEVQIPISSLDTLIPIVVGLRFNLELNIFLISFKIQQ